MWEVKKISEPQRKLLTKRSPGLATRRFKVQEKGNIFRTYDTEQEARDTAERLNLHRG